MNELKTLLSETLDKLNQLNMTRAAEHISGIDDVIDNIADLVNMTDEELKNFE